VAQVHQPAQSECRADEPGKAVNGVADTLAIGALGELVDLYGMAKPDLPNFSIFGRIVFGLIALLMAFWLLRLSGVV
jgi:hypothetical protein